MNEHESAVTEISVTAEGCRVVTTQVDGGEHIELSKAPASLVIAPDFVKERGRVWPQRA